MAVTDLCRYQEIQFSDTAQLQSSLTTFCYWMMEVIIKKCKWLTRLQYSFFFAARVEQGGLYSYICSSVATCIGIKNCCGLGQRLQSNKVVQCPITQPSDLELGEFLQHAELAHDCFLDLFEHFGRWLKIKQT